MRAFALLLILLATACGRAAGVIDTGSRSAPNTDPRTGWVEVTGNIWKMCDGATLLYAHQGIAVVVDSPECKPS